MAHIQPPTLFDVGFDDWVENPILAFSSWLSRRDLKKSSMVVYLSMWEKFTRWLGDCGYRLDTLDGKALSKFPLDTRQEKLHTYRYLRLIETVYAHLATLPRYPVTLGNPAQNAIVSLQTKYRNDDTSFMPEWGRRRLLSFVRWGELGEEEEEGEIGKGVETCKGGKEEKSHPIGNDLLPVGSYIGDSTRQNTLGSGQVDSVEKASAVKDKTKTSRLSGPAGEWKMQRDLALVGTFIGGGLRVHEAIGLTVNCISVDRKRITIPQHITPKNADDNPSTFERTVELEPEAADALKRWMLVRNRGTYGEAVFPSNPKGKPMDPSSVFRRVKIILDEAQLNELDGRSCCQTLRNSYIATLFDRECEDMQIAEIAGFAELVSVARIHASYNANFRRAAGELDLPEIDDDSLGDI